MVIVTIIAVKNKLLVIKQGSEIDSNEDTLLEMYSHGIAKLSDISYYKAKKMVREAINMCKKEMVEDGWRGDIPDMGEIILAKARSGDKKWVEVVTKAYEDGCSDVDIIEWWNLPSLNRRMVIWSESVFRMSTWLCFKEEGLTDEQTAIQIHKIFPKYRSPDTPRDKGDEDAYLCHEIRGRVDEYRIGHSAERTLEEVKNYSTFNAWVRVKIRSGEL